MRRLDHKASLLMSRPHPSRRLLRKLLRARNTQKVASIAFSSSGVTSGSTPNQALNASRA